MVHHSPIPERVLIEIVDEVVLPLVRAPGEGAETPGPEPR